MQISFNWLATLVALPKGVGPGEVAERLTHCGLEVEASQTVGAGISKVIVAEVRGKRPHPKADKLTLVDVFDGETVTQVVCGAPNVPDPAGGAPGSLPRVVWARPGAQLPSGITLGEKEVRGVVSPGMLCAEDELGLSTDHGGILILSEEDGIPIGADFAKAAGLPDVILTLNVTPNRPDCLGHVGVAREVAALFAKEGARLTLPQPDLSGHLLAKGEEPTIEVVITEKDGGPRYTARVLRGVRVCKSPLRDRLLLSRLGVRAISNLVDATNLTMLEWGQPLHAFDLGKVKGGKIVVRRAHEGETLKTLDDQVRSLLPTDLLIADGHERGSAIAIAGVMGGADSEVTQGTTDILLESAYFHPSWIRKTARRLRLHSEASHRFERGVDPNEGVLAASLRCAERMIRTGGGKVGPTVVDTYARRIEPHKISVRPERVRRVLGDALPDSVQREYLGALGLSVEGQGELTVTVPTRRPDLTREADLIEEIGRIHGYNNIPALLPPLSLHAAENQVPVSGDLRGDLARDLCVGLGLDEIMTFSFVAPERLKALGFAGEDQRSQPVILHNPLREELSAMRTQLACGLLEALFRHVSHGQKDVRLFEVGEVFLAKDPQTLVQMPSDPAAARDALRTYEKEHGRLPVIEKTRVGGVLCGRRDHHMKASSGDELDLFDIRGIVEELLQGLGLTEVTIRQAGKGEAPWLHPGVSALVLHQGEVIGEFGEVHPDLRQKMGIETRAFGFELDVAAKAGKQPSYVVLPKYPGASRDLSFFVAEATPAGELSLILKGAGQALLTEVQVMEDYREAGRVPQGKKGMLFTLIYRAPDRTLTDEEVNQAHQKVIAHLQQAASIDLR